MLWGQALWEWCRTIYTQRQELGQRTPHDLRLRIPLPPRWTPTPLQPWLRWWGLAASLLPLGLGVAAAIWFAVMFFAVGPNGTYPDGAFAYVVLAAIPLMLLGATQMTFFLRSVRRGAIGITLFLVLLTYMAGLPLVRELELALLLVLWLTGGVAAPLSPANHKDT